MVTQYWPPKIRKKKTNPDTDEQDEQEEAQEQEEPEQKEEYEDETLAEHEPEEDAEESQGQASNQEAGETPCEDMADEELLHSLGLQLLSPEPPSAYVAREPQQQCQPEESWRVAAPPSDNIDERLAYVQLFGLKHKIIFHETAGNTVIDLW